MHKRTVLLSLALASLTVSGVAFPARAEGDGTPSLRAANLARMKAETLNGGLQVYRAAACMHERAGGPCLLTSTDEGYLFRFYGGGPGWQQLGDKPTVETEILVSPDGRTIEQVIYNGPPRSTSAGQ
jgi:hypothetical protein